MTSIFGLEHILYFLIVVTIMIISLMLIKKYVKTDKRIFFVIKIIGLLLLVAISYNRISIAICNEDLRLLWPDSFCGTSSLVMAITAIFFKKNNNILHCVRDLGL